jgi:HEAT repeat protein
MSIVPPPTPRERVERAAITVGADAVVADCVAIIEGRRVDDDVIMMLGGLPATQVLSGAEGGRDGYWPRVWALRGLLHVWRSEATPALITGLSDPAWRAREMAAKVAARYRVQATRPALEVAITDEIERVREAAYRAIHALEQHRPTSGT